MGSGFTPLVGPAFSGSLPRRSVTSWLLSRKSALPWIMRSPGFRSGGEKWRPTQGRLALDRVLNAAARNMGGARRRPINFEMSYPWRRRASRSDSTRSSALPFFHSCSGEIAAIYGYPLYRALIYETVRSDDCSDRTTSERPRQSGIFSLERKAYFLQKAIWSYSGPGALSPLVRSTVIVSVTR